MTSLHWISFMLLILGLLGVDLFVLHRKKKPVSLSQALLSTLFWIALALLFNLFVYWTQGSEAALNFLTGYLIEKTLSLDNLFVIWTIFHAFHTPPQALHKVLFWGVVGALVMRLLMIAIGIQLLHYFSFLFYILGAILVVMGLRGLFQKAAPKKPKHSPLIHFLATHFPFTKEHVEERFFIKRGSRWLATPLLLALIAIESSDLIFALDSIPAIFGITLDPFIVYTSNIFAILGMRSLFFALSSLLKVAHTLHYGIALILIFIGLKMVLEPLFTIPVIYTLLFVALVLTLSLLFLKYKKKAKDR